MISITYIFISKMYYIDMSNVTYCLRLDENLKFKFEKTCESMGISMSAALNLFVTTVVNEQRIPFVLKAKPYDPDEIWRSLERARMKVCKQYPNGMTLDEINEIIDEVRAEDD